MGTKEYLTSALNGDERATTELCLICKQIALAYLRAKSKRMHFLLQYLYRDADDLALDCIADLFGSEEKCLGQIRDYFRTEELNELSEGETENKLRRLVFSKVNEGLYRNYKSFDPSLSRIIRNLKRSLEENKAEGVYYNASKGRIIAGESSDRLPLIPDELLEIKFTGRIAQVNNSVDALNELKELLNSQTLYRKEVNLIGFAVSLRKIFARQFELEENGYTEPASGYNSEEIEEYIQRSIAKQRSAFLNTYVHSGKMHEHEMDRYCRVIRSVLSASYAAASENEGHFEHFCEVFGDAEYEDYRRNHRKIIEYMLKKVRSQLISDLRQEAKISRNLLL